jgi:hypothetical protein
MAPTPARRAPRVEPAHDEQIGSPIQPPPPVEAPSRPSRDPLAAIAEEFAVTPAQTAPGSARNRPAAPPPARPQVAAETRPEPRQESRQEPRVPSQPASIEPSPADQSLAEMAQRLEAALRKPKAEAKSAASVAEQPAEPEVAAVPPPAPPVAAPQPPVPARTARAAAAAEVKPVRADTKPKDDAKDNKQGKALYDTLEQEMASLLGRPAGKT